MGFKVNTKFYEDTVSHVVQVPSGEKWVPRDELTPYQAENLPDDADGAFIEQLEDTDWVIDLRGPHDSKSVSAVQDYLRAARVNDVKRERATAPDDIVKLEEDRVELIKKMALDRISGWRGLEDDDGEEIPYSPETASKILNQPNLSFVFNQIFDKLNDRENFTIKA